VPVRFRFVQLGGQCLFKPPLLDGSFKTPLPCRFAEADQPFFTLSKLRTWNTSWTMPLLLSGDSAISSLAAATQIQKAGWDRKSMGGVGEMVMKA